MLNNEERAQLNELIKELVAFDAEKEVQDLFARGVKYITDSPVRDTISPALEERLESLEKLIVSTLTHANGKPKSEMWRELSAYGGGGNYWVRSGQEDLARLATKNVSIAFDCMC